MEQNITTKQKNTSRGKNKLKYVDSENIAQPIEIKDISSLKTFNKATISRTRVVLKVWRMAEKQVQEIENRMGGFVEDASLLDRDAKTLGVIAKTIRDLVAIETEAKTTKNLRKDKVESAKNGSQEADDSERSSHIRGPRSIAEFRAELARKLDELREERGGIETT